MTRTRLVAAAALVAGAGLLGWRALDDEPKRPELPTRLRVAMLGTTEGVADTLLAWSEPVRSAGLALERSLAGRPPTAIGPAAQRLERTASRALVAMQRQPPLDDYDPVKIRAEDAFDQYAAAGRLAARAERASRGDPGAWGFAESVEAALRTVRVANRALADAHARMSPSYGAELLEGRTATRP